MKSADFLIITPVGDELNAVLKGLPDVRRLPPDAHDIHIYYRAELPLNASNGVKGRYTIMVVALQGPGRVEAAAATGDAIRRCQPRYILLLGAALGHGEHIRVGDVLVADRVVDYEQQEYLANENGGAEPQTHYQVYPADPRLLAAAKDLSSFRTTEADVIAVGGAARRHSGPLLSGDKLSLRPAALARYATEWPSLIGVETEAGGVVVAAHQSACKPGVLMVRGVCKLTRPATASAEDRQLAATAAADYAIALLGEAPVPLADRGVDVYQGADGSALLGAVTAACKTLQPEQLRRVSRDNYLHELYVDREVDRQIREFIDSDQHFARLARPLLVELSEINQLYGLRADVAEMQQAVERGASDEELGRCLDSLKQSFRFEEVGTTLRMMEATITVANEDTFEAQTRRICAAVAALPFSYRQLPTGTPSRQERIQADLTASLREMRARAKMQGLRRVPLGAERWLENSFPMLPANQTRAARLGNTLLMELAQLRQRAAARCLAIVGPAGCGKTNTMCHAAAGLDALQPTMLLAGQVEEIGRLGIAGHVRARLETVEPRLSANWLRLLEQPLRAAGRWLIILVDGINEALKLQEMLAALSDFLALIEGSRIKLIFSCRDIFWDFFEPHVKKSLFDGQALRQSSFSESEESNALQRYFMHFDITCSQDKLAQSHLRSPLLLRFFCEANRGKHLQQIGALDLLDVFDRYVDYACSSIGKRLGLLKPRVVLGQMLSIAKNMWQTGTTLLPISALALPDKETTSPDSVYSLLRGEGVIFEETSGPYGDSVSIRFVYDLFMEYVLARSWAAELPVGVCPGAQTDAIVREAAARILEFGPVLGALVFLDKVLKLGGLLVNRAIPMLIAAAPKLLEMRQTSILFAFQHINLEAADEALFTHLNAFERVAQPEIKEQLTSIILALLERNPDQPMMQKLASRMLEIDELKGAERSNTANTASAEGQGLLGAALGLLGTLPGHIGGLDTLPPARHHYTEQSRLTALTMLASGTSEQSYEMVERGTRQLGSLELQSALQAVAALDRADDGFVLKLIPRYLGASASEYRIYCAWLLRARYGELPAQFLLRLLTDQDTRVHEYTFDVCVLRGIEIELHLAMVSWLESKKQNLKSWHLLHLLRLVGRRSLLRNSTANAKQAQRTADALALFTNHPHLSIRTAVCKGLIEYQALTDVKKPLEQLRRRGDRAILDLLKGVAE